jgi:glycerophosphoryl diester phosphodiesterase
MNRQPAHTPHPWRIAHRGARDEAPENTNAAFEKALDYPIDGIEMDIQMSADGVPVIYHDATLWRICRRRRRVAELTRAQLAQLDWGAWFHRDFSGEPLPTLEQVLVRFGPRTRLLLEIKSLPADRSTGHVERLVRNCLQLLAEARHQLLAEHVYVLSFDPHALQLAHRLAPQWQYVLNAPQRRPGQTMALAEEETDHLAGLCVEIGALKASLVDWGRSRGLRVLAYTCNGPRQVRKARRLGVDAIMTDRPGWLTHYLDGRNGQ